MGTIKGIKCVEIFRNHRTDRDPDVMKEEMIAAGIIADQDDESFWQKILQVLGGNYMNPAAMLFAEYELYESDKSFSQILNDSWETWSNEMKVAIQIWFFGVSDLIQQNWEQWDYSASYKLSLYEEQAIKKNIDFSNKYLVSNNTNNYGIDPSKLEMTETVKKHYNELFRGDRIITINNEGYRTIHYVGESTRPYVAKGSSIIMDEIMKSGTPVSDPQGVPGGLRWIVEGYFNKVHGYWELVIDTEKNMVIHFLYNSK